MRPASTVFGLAAWLAGWLAGWLRHPIANDHESASFSFAVCCLSACLPACLSGCVAASAPVRAWGDRKYDTHTARERERDRRGEKEEPFRQADRQGWQMGGWCSALGSHTSIDRQRDRQMGVKWDSPCVCQCAWFVRDSVCVCVCVCRALPNDDVQILSVLCCPGRRCLAASDAGNW